MYTIDWSARSKRVVSAGSDGKIVVYEEQPPHDTPMVRTSEAIASQSDVSKEWKAIAEFENAHGVFEINHVCWSMRWDRGKATNEEVIISTGDDGEVKVWSLSEV